MIIGAVLSVYVTGRDSIEGISFERSVLQGGSLPSPVDSPVSGAR